MRNTNSRGADEIAAKWNRSVPPEKRLDKPAVYVRINADTLRRVERHVSELQDATEAKVTQSDAIRDLIRRGLEEADVERGRRARRKR